MGSYAVERLEKRLYRVLVVDDFLVDRVNMRTLVEALGTLEVEVCGEAENGLSAIEAIEVYRPDIIITDIEMPISDGFELAKHVRMNHPEIRIIFCSLYDEFEYAQKALYFGSYGYILKPINAEELRQCIASVIGSINNELSIREQTREYTQVKELMSLYKPVLADHFLVGLLHGLENGTSESVLEKALYLGVPLVKSIYYLLYLEIDEFDRATAGQSAEQRQILSVKVREKVKELLASTGNHIIMGIDESHFVGVLQIDSLQASMADKVVDECCNEISMGFRKSDISITISVSNCAEDILDLHHLYKYCCYLMKHKFMLGGGKIIKGTDVPSANAYQSIDFNSIIMDVRCILNSGSSLDIDNYIERLFTENPAAMNEQYLKNMSFMLVACAQIIISENNEAFTERIGSDIFMLNRINTFETKTEEKNWIKSIFHTINVQLAKKARTKNHQIVVDIIAYIERNFVKNINMDTLAADLYYSANYLNRIFKQETGDTIFDYATKYRIEKAKALLSDHRVKLYEITDMLGYSNPAYFSGVFKKHTGMTPKEYRERNAR